MQATATEASSYQVAEYMQRKALSRDRWLTGMRRLRDKIYGAAQSG